MKAFLLSILVKIKTMSVAAKVITSVATVIIVGGGTTAIIIANDSEVREDIGQFMRQETEQEIMETKEIPFDKKEEQDENKYKGETETRQEGIAGEKVVKYKVIFNKDGNEIFREKISEEIVKEPIDEIIVIGTKKKEERSIATNNTNITNDKPVSSTNNADDTQTLEYLCKNKIVGWDRPNNCPTHQTRAEYTALGGWELTIRNEYESLKNDPNFKVVSAEGLCYSGFTMDLNNMTISDVHWSNQPTSTCDKVRDENPPLPSEEYLTSYLRSIVK